MRALFSDRRFATYFCSRQLGSLAYSIEAVAVGWQIYAITHAALALGLVGLILFLPQFALAIPAGVLADRFERRAIALACSIAEALGVIAFALLAWQGSTLLWLYALALLFIGIAHATSAPAERTLLVGIVDAAISSQYSSAVRLRCSRSTKERRSAPTIRRLPPLAGGEAPQAPDRALTRPTIWHTHGAMIADMESVSRKVVYRLYPSHSQETALLDMLGLHQRLYNAALEQRIAAWRLRRKSLSAYDQMRDLTDLRADDERYAALNAQSAQVTLNRLHLAFAAFFRRCKKGETPGFPRFQSFDRCSGWGYKHHGDGFRFVPGDGNRHGRLRLSGIGTIPVRGRARTPGEVKTCEIQHKTGRWYASLTVTCEPQRGSGSDAIGLDWGVETFATLAHEDGTYSSVENPRFFGGMKAALESAQQNLARKAKRSKNRAKARKRVALIQRKTANRRHDFLHQKSAKVVASVDLIATESLSIKNMTRSAKGTVESPGRNVAQKAGLNREILATAPRAFLDILRYKAAEAGIAFIEVPSRKVKPSQTCSGCGIQRKKALSQRQ
ncbi:MAG TPA: RNA-guided endonuclease TnpB family protein, partial [Candidatus Dormibacteraeota bacterium]|nr:RNA-guided endonuclease TnpB family protein [Candidatus Dormibacteraeota bacterium]